MPLRFAVFGAGFWTRYQLSAWKELPGARCIAIYNRTRSKAESIARDFGIPAVYDDPEQLLREAKPDFVDNITEIDGHVPLTLLCAQHQVPTICQKPLAPSLAEARKMISACARAGVPLLVHENWRWQTPMRRLKQLIDSGVIGNPFRGRITMISGYEGWVNQPALARLKQFILTDLGTHILDTARCLFGEAASLHCHTASTLPEILQGENVATVLMIMGKARTHVVCEMAYARTPLERECFPQTLAFVEGPLGSIEVTENYGIRITTAKGTHLSRHAPPRYAWANPQYDIAHASIVACHRNLLAHLQGKGMAETTGADNLKTLELVYGCYESARRNSVLKFRIP